MRSTPLACALVFAFACAKNQPGGGDPLVSPDSGVDPNNPPITLDSGIPNNPSDMYTRVFITPANPTVLVENGAPSSVDLELYGTDQSGTDQKITGPVLWRTNDDRLGGFAEETRPHYVATGDRAGTAMIEAHFGNLNATTTVKVELLTKRTEGGAPNDADTKFTAPVINDPARAANIIYPADRTMIPKNLVPMELQWDAPAGVDLFRVVLRGPNASATIYTATRSVRLVKAEWVKILESTAPGDLTMEIAAVNSAAPSEVIVGSPVTIHVADAQMRGTIYYWALNIGRILRIRPGAENYEDFFTPPPLPDGNSCVGCHTLSRNGSRMAFEYYGGWQSHGIIDVVTPNPPLIAPGVFSANFSAFNPSGDRLLSVIGGVLTLREPVSGAPFEDLATNGVQATHPAWSPDGATIAYIAQVAGQGFNDVDFFLSDLTVIRDASGARSAPEILVPADGLANSYPSFSPDSRHLAYMRGPFSRSHTSFDVNAPSALSLADLYMVPIDRSAPPVKLERASAAGQAYLPAYSPFSGGGVTWLAFFSRRDYGNVTRGSLRRQVWVTAISEGTPAGVDPSHPAFWLPAQDATTENMSAYWAPDPCHGDGATCVLDDDCCGGTLCRPDANGVRTCIPSTQACRMIGELCADSGECCPGANVSCAPTPEGPRCAMTQL